MIYMYMYIPADAFDPASASGQAFETKLLNGVGGLGYAMRSLLLQLLLMAGRVCHCVSLLR